LVPGEPPAHRDLGGDPAQVGELDRERGDSKPPLGLVDFNDGATLDEERLRAETAWAPGEWCFTDEIGQPLRPDGLTLRFTSKVRALGLPATDIKGLRHAHATALLRAGVHPKVVQERLGHSSISVTMDIYSSVLPGMQREAVEKLAAMMGDR
jgi:integrase